MRWGPQPYAGLLSAVCEAFHCPPDVAERQAWRTVQAIFDYRNAKVAVELFNQGAKGVAEFERHPELAELLVEMQRAQTDCELTTADVLADMARRGGEAEDG